MLSHHTPSSFLLFQNISAPLPSLCPHSPIFSLTLCRTHGLALPSPGAGTSEGLQAVMTSCCESEFSPLALGDELRGQGVPARPPGMGIKLQREGSLLQKDGRPFLAGLGAPVT